MYWVCDTREDKADIDLRIAREDVYALGGEKLGAECAFVDCINVSLRNLSYTALSTA